MLRSHSFASRLAWLYVGLIVYASLYPFSGWRVPGAPLFHFLLLPWSHWWTGFDLVSNLLGYVPLGVLVFGARLRTGSRSFATFGEAVTAGFLLSLAMESLQDFLPMRVASNVDLGLNALGTSIGAALGVWAQGRGSLGRWQTMHDRWFIHRSAGALALLTLWPVGLLFPLPAPLGMGQVMVQLQDAIGGLLEGTPAADWFAHWLTASPDPSALSSAGEFALIATGLLAPCLVAFSVAQPGWRRLALVLGVVLLGALTTTLSTALNFGPQHALAWSTSRAWAAFAAASALAAVLSAVPRRVAAALGLMALTALVTVVVQAPADPYFAQSLQAWEQGRFIRFHGAARWVGWLWPYAAIACLLVRISSRDEGSDGRPLKMGR